jgi:phosphate transport system substrate-binding protein
MRFWFTRCLCVCISTALFALAQGGEILRVGGTGAGLGGLQALAKVYELRHPERSVRILPSIGSTGGIRAVLEGRLDVGCVSRPLLPEERGPGLAELPWATTAYVFATQSATPAEPLTLAGIEDIYAGRRTHWKDGRPIRLILRPKSDTAHAYLTGFTPGMRAALDRAHALPGVCIGLTDQAALAHLEQTPGSFGTTVLGLIASEGRRVQALTVDGINPTQRTYPFVLALTLVHRNDRSSPAIRAFLDFAFSKEAQSILIKAGYQPISAGAAGARK